MLNESIIEIIKQGASDQTILLKKLKELGYSTTQSSISRKLKQMNIQKIQGKYKITSHEDKKIKNVKFVEPNLFVVRTAPGYAAAIASVIDRHIENNKYPEIAGTIAGDDAIFIAVSCYKNLTWIETRIKEILSLT